MNVYNNLEDVQPTEARAVALGLFDGVHSGHLYVIKKALDSCMRGLKPAVFTYRIQHKIPENKGDFQWINSEDDRLEILKNIGVHDVVQPTFEDFRDMSPEEFVVDFLIKRMNAKFISCGSDFRFGKKAAGNVELMKKLCEPYGVEVCVVKAVELDGVISSTRIREYIRQGNMPMAWRLLGRPYSICFEVVSGNKIGRTLNFPTINQVYPDNFVIPKYGVYVSITEIDGKAYHSLTNVGVKPTVGSDYPLAETYIIGFSGDLYGRNLRVNLCQFIRPEIKFASLDELKAQIERDTIQANLMSPGFAVRMEEMWVHI